jgi:K+-transporting ATPase ATPase C chain
MLQGLRINIVIFAVFTVILCGVYPAVVTGVSYLLMPAKAEGSLIKDGNKVIGSALVGQSFSEPKYFWGRPSATGPVPYNAAASSGSNLGAASSTLEANIKARIDQLEKADGHKALKVPVDLVTASGSGLDPHISPEAAEYQVARVAQMRKMDIQVVRDYVQKNTEARQFGILGEPRVNVLRLNKALDEIPTK